VVVVGSFSGKAQRCTEEQPPSQAAVAVEGLRSKSVKELKFAGW